MTIDSEPARETGPALLEIRDELAEREPIFHRPEFGTTRADFDAMITADFWETGASGRRYGRTYVLDELEKRYQDPGPDPWETSDFHCQELAPGLYLLTYTLRQDARITRRATIWKRAEPDWKIVYHQGTLVQDS